MPKEKTGGGVVRLAIAPLACLFWSPGIWLGMNGIKEKGAIAQITPDATLPNVSITTTTDNTITITGGTRSGSHLFHSFQDFSIAADQIAQFDHALDLNTLITRVTGTSISTIDGRIESQGSTDFFLLNPNGIVFGESADLNVGGSFIASTADSLVFDTGETFSAADPQAPPLLTLNTPVGLQYGRQPGDILVNGSGHNLSIDDETLEIMTSDRPAGLAVNTGETLALLGGAVTLTGGNLTAEGGRIILGGIGTNTGANNSTGETITLISDELGWVADFSRISQPSIVVLQSAASALTSGEGGGAIQMAGQFIDVLDGSTLLANTLGSSDGNTIMLQATEELIVTGTQVDATTQTPLFPSSIFAEVNSAAAGDGGSITLSAPFIDVSDGGLVSTGVFGAGTGGDITVNAEGVELSSGTAEFGPSGFFLDVDTAATGNGGNFTLQADELSLSGGADISASTLGFGNAGQIEIVTNTLDLIGGAADLGPSTILSQVDGRGNAGSIRIESDRIQILEGARISSNTLGGGDGGTLEIIADSLTVEGTSPSGMFASQVSSLVQEEQEDAFGNGGDIILTVNQLTVTAGAEITSSTFATGQAGNVEINAQSIQLTGIDDLSTSIFAAAEADATGDSGQLTIRTNTLAVQNGAQIVTGTLGSGDGGDLTIVANTITLDGRNNVTNSGLFASALIDNGAGGSINVDTDTLLIKNGAAINASNTSAILATGQGAAGNININARSLQLQNEGQVTTSTIVGDRGNIVLNSDLILLQDRSSIVTNAQSDATGGNIAINTDYLIANPNENSDITANAVRGRGGSITITAQRILGLEFRDELTPQSDITVSSEFGVDGEVIIDLLAIDSTSDLGKLPSSVVDESDRIATGCPADRGANFIATGRGGLPADPTQSLVEEVLLHAFETSSFPNYSATITPPPSPHPTTPNAYGDAPRFSNARGHTLITEAQGWQRDRHGNIQLFGPNNGVRLSRRVANTNSPTTSSPTLPIAPHHAATSKFCQGGHAG